MFHTTQAVILGCQPLNDRATLLMAYTRAHGRANYIIYGAHSRRKSNALFLPLSLVELTYADKPNGSMPVLESSQLAYIPHNIPTDVYRQTIAIFMAEVLLNTLILPLQDETLFTMLEQLIVLLDETDSPENIHLIFLHRLAEALGFAIDSTAHPDWFQLPTSRIERQNQLKQLCGYFALQIDSWQQPKSLDVLIEVFN